MMNKLLKTVAVLALTFPLTAPISAQTPDEAKPAQEGVCDVLQESGTTKGLYGLCVAFCEAQDTTSISDPITEEELEAIEASAPSGKILEKYNQKKSDTDPAMPCVKVEEACPCFSDAELDELDGFRELDNSQTSRFVCYDRESNFLFDSYLVIREYNFNPNYYHKSATVLERSDNLGGGGACIFRNQDPLISTNENRHLSTGSETLSEAQLNACKLKLSSRIESALCDLR